jgi:hypothetical protein
MGMEVSPYSGSVGGKGVMRNRARDKGRGTGPSIKIKRKSEDVLEWEYREGKA